MCQVPDDGLNENGRGVWWCCYESEQDTGRDPEDQRRLAKRVNRSDVHGAGQDPHTGNTRRTPKVPSGSIKVIPENFPDGQS